MEESWTGYCDGVSLHPRWKTRNHFYCNSITSLWVLIKYMCIKLIMGRKGLHASDQGTWEGKVENSKTSAGQGRHFRDISWVRTWWSHPAQTGCMNNEQRMWLFPHELSSVLSKAHGGHININWLKCFDCGIAWRIYNLLQTIKC